MAKIPAFARASSLEVLENALISETGALYDLDRIAYCVLSDTDRLAYIDANKQIHLIVGANKPNVVLVDALPPAEEADTDVLYIFNEIVYIWNGTEYKPTFYAVAQEIDALNLQLNTLESRVGTLEASTADIEDRISTFENAIDGINRNIADIVDDINALELTKANADNVYTKTEVDALLEVDTPSGSMTIPEYVDTSVAGAVQTAQEYTDQQLEIRFV